MYDVIIIGAGPAGVSASLYTQRANLKTLIIYYGKSSLQKAENIENYYGFEHGISGKDLYELGIRQAQNIGVEVKGQEVVNVEQLINEDAKFRVTTVEGKYESKALIFAMGNEKNRPKIKGIERFEGKGVSYCAVCDGFFYRNKDVVVLGSGNYAISEVNELINVVKSVAILTNGKSSPEFRADNVKIETKPIEEITGKGRVEEVRFKDGTTLKTSGVFVAQGVAGSLDLAKKLGVITKNNNIVVNENMETNMQGLYACGDCVGGLLQVSKAVGDGAKAGMEAIKFIRKIHNS